MHGISLSARTLLRCGENVTLRLVSDIRRGARRATRAGHGVTGLGLPGHLDSPGPDSEVRALRLRRPVTGLGTGAAISASGPDASSESDCRHTPFKTRLKNKIKTICEPCGPVLKTFATSEEVNQRMILSGHLLSLER